MISSHRTRDEVWKMWRNQKILNLAMLKKSRPERLISMLPKFFGIYTYSLILCRSRLKAKMATKCCRLLWSSPWWSPSFSSFWRQCFLHFTSQKVREFFRLNLRGPVWKWKELFFNSVEKGNLFVSQWKRNNYRKSAPLCIQGVARNI